MTTPKRKRPAFPLGSTRQEVRDIFKAHAVQAHPDKPSGNSEAFRALYEEYAAALKRIIPKTKGVPTPNQQSKKKKSKSKADPTGERPPKSKADPTGERPPFPPDDAPYEEFLVWYQVLMVWRMADTTRRQRTPENCEGAIQELQNIHGTAKICTQCNEEKIECTFCQRATLCACLKQGSRRRQVRSTEIDYSECQTCYIKLDLFNTSSYYRAYVQAHSKRRDRQFSTGRRPHTNWWDFLSKPNQVISWQDCI